MYWYIFRFDLKIYCIYQLWFIQSGAFNNIIQITDLIAGYNHKILLSNSCDLEMYSIAWLIFPISPK